MSHDDEKAPAEDEYVDQMMASFRHARARMDADPEEAARISQLASTTESKLREANDKAPENQMSAEPPSRRHSTTPAAQAPNTAEQDLRPLPDRPRRQGHLPTAANAGTKPGKTSVKVVIAGGFGTGKSTFIEAVSDISPLITRPAITVGLSTDDLGQDTAGVSMDFGRVSLDGDLVLYLFSAPGQERLRFMWDDMFRGAVGAVVLVDPRRMSDSFPVIDYFEASGLPLVIAVNGFHGYFPDRSDEVRKALSIPFTVPIIPCDPRNRLSAKETLAALVEHAIPRQDIERNVLSVQALQQRQ